ncbi:hypothetical protein ACM66B_003393 [Microbotryomycetes sp. NB124-2]
MTRPSSSSRQRSASSSRHRRAFDLATRTSLPSSPPTRSSSRASVARPPDYSDSSDSDKSLAWSTDGHDGSDSDGLLGRASGDEEKLVGGGTASSRESSKRTKKKSGSSNKSDKTSSSKPSKTFKPDRWCTPKIAILSGITAVIIIAMCAIAGYLINDEFKNKKDHHQSLNETLSSLDASTRSTASLGLETGRANATVTGMTGFVQATALNIAMKTNWPTAATDDD